MITVFLSFLLFCNFVIPIIIIAQRIISRRGVEFDHIFLFSCGFVFYWILPIAVGGLNYYIGGTNNPMMIIWYDIFHRLTDYQLIAYLLYTLVFYSSFIIGDLSSTKIAKHPLRKTYSFDSKLLDIPLLIAIIMCGCFAYPLRDYFFTGYKIMQMHPGIGQFTAAAILLLSFAFMYVKTTQEESRTSLTFFKLIFNKAFIAYLIFAIILVSLGGRLVFVSSILMICVLYSVYFKPINILYVVAIFFTIIIVSHIIVMFRIPSPTGMFVHDKYYLEKILLYLLSDNMSVSFSLIHFLNNYTLPVLQFPTILFSRLITIIPSFIFPAKTAFIVPYGNLGYEIFSPLGGLNSFVSFVIHFGTVGTAIFMFCISFFLGWLKTKLIQPYQTMYIMICGWLAISFFRYLDVTIIKLIFQFSILIPFLMTIILVKISNIRPKKDG